MRFQLLAPVSLAIDGDTLAEALKNYVKITKKNMYTNIIIL